jgi:excisionase family DNA binding protein
MDYITIKEASEQWGISIRAITYHVAAGRIEGAMKIGNLWLIPKAAARPEDRRKKDVHKDNDAGNQDQS